MKYIILWETKGNEETDDHYMIVHDSVVEGYLSEIASETGAWGNYNIECYELGNKVEIEISTIAKIKV